MDSRAGSGDAVSVNYLTGSALPNCVFVWQSRKYCQVNDTQTAQAIDCIIHLLSGNKPGACFLLSFTERPQAKLAKVNRSYLLPSRSESIACHAINHNKTLCLPTGLERRCKYNANRRGYRLEQKRFRVSAVPHISYLYAFNTAITVIKRF